MSYSVTGVVFDSSDLFEIHEQMMLWRGQVRKLTKASLASVYADRYAHALDNAISRGNPIPNRILSTVRSTVQDEQEKVRITHQRNPLIDFEFELSLIPFEGEVYGIVRCEQYKWFKKFKRAVAAKDFSYWNSSDKPRHITNKLWEERSRIWNGIFDRSLIPCETSFEVICTARSHHQPEKREIFKALPTHAVRVRRVAVDRAFHQRMEVDEKYQEAVIAHDGKPPVHEYSSAFFRISKWLKSEQGKCMIAIEAGHVISLLPQITIDML